MRIFKILTCSIVLLFSMAVNASTINLSGSWIHDGGSDASDYNVTIDDNTAGRFTFNVSVTALALTTDPNTDLLGFFFDAGGNYFSDSDLGISGSDVTSTGFNTLSCGKGCNLNGLTSDAFEVGVRIGNNGSPYIPTTTFSINALSGMSLNDFTRVGVRAQSTGFTGNGSDKAIIFSRVPEPASLLLMSVGLIGLGVMRKKRK